MFIIIKTFRKSSGAFTDQNWPEKKFETLVGIGNFFPLGEVEEIILHESKVHILLNHWSCSLSYHVSGINAEGECKKIIFFKSLILLYIENFSYYCSFDFWLYFNLFNHPIFLHVSVLLFFILSFHPLIFALQGKEKVAFPLSLSFSSFFFYRFFIYYFF